MIWNGYKLKIKPTDDINPYLKIPLVNGDLWNRAVRMLPRRRLIRNPGAWLVLTWPLGFEGVADKSKINPINIVHHIVFRPYRPWWLGGSHKPRATSFAKAQDLPWAGNITAFQAGRVITLKGG